MVDGITAWLYRLNSIYDKLLTGTGGLAGPKPRLRVDPGQTGFFEGKMFRAYKEFSGILTNGTNPLAFRFISPINFILWSQDLTLTQGAVRYEIFTGAVTPSGSWTGISPIGVNRSTEAPQPPYASQVTIETGGTFTGGTPVDLMMIRTASTNGQSSNIGGANSERFLPAGTYYGRISVLTGGLTVNDPAQGVLDLAWEERP